MSRVSANTLLTQLIDDYLDEEQCLYNFFFNNTDDTAVQLIGDTYSAALHAPPSILRRLLCLSLCTEQESAAHHSCKDAPSNMRRRSHALYVRPSPQAIGLARSLLVHLAQNNVDSTAWIPIFSIHAKDEWERLRHRINTNTLYFSTPFAFWADIAVPHAFESVWDLLLREPIHAAERESPFPLHVNEFWMSTNDMQESSQDEAHEGSIVKTVSTYLTQGAWRTLDALISIWSNVPQPRLLGDEGEHVSKALKILFSFGTSPSYMQDSFDLMEERAMIASRLMHFFTQSNLTCDISGAQFRQIGAQHLQNVPFTSLYLLCNVMPHLTLFQDICYTYLFMVYIDARAPAQYLYDENVCLNKTKLMNILNTPCQFIDQCKMSSFVSLTTLDMAFRCLWIKWWLLCVSGHARAVRDTSIMKDSELVLKFMCHSKTRAENPDLLLLSKHARKLLLDVRKHSM